MQGFLDRLLAHERYFITTHLRPDGDAIGSQLALARFLTKLGKHVTLINADPPPDALAWLPGVDAVEVFDGSIRQRELIDAADAVVIVDTNALDRVGKVGAAVKAARGTSYLIDHHTSPEAWFDAALSVDTASSTGELVYGLIEAHDPGLIDTPLAEALYTAIMTDTGSFRFASVTPRVHRIVADLLERGKLSPAPIHVALYDTRRLGALRLLARALETITLAHEGQVATMTLSLRLMRSSDAHSDETEGFVNYALSIGGVKAAVIFLETAAGVKMSFRSKGDTYVHEWARHFGGGGHRNASGAFVTKPLERLIHEVIDVAPRYLAFGGEGTPPDDADLLAMLKQKFHAT